MRGFADAVFSWEPRVLASAAAEYFRVSIRRHPSDVCWSWALEWNANLRLVGFFGEKTAAQTAFDGLPQLLVQDFPITPTSGFRLRTEVPLEDDKDLLFSVDAATADPV